jgi:hypothetical protein
MLLKLSQAAGASLLDVTRVLAVTLVVPLPWRTGGALTRLLQEGSLRVLLQLLAPPPPPLLLGGRGCRAREGSAKRTTRGVGLPSSC